MDIYGCDVVVLRPLARTRKRKQRHLPSSTSFLPSGSSTASISSTFTSYFNKTSPVNQSAIQPSSKNPRECQRIPENPGESQPAPATINLRRYNEIIGEISKESSRIPPPHFLLPPPARPPPRPPYPSMCFSCLFRQYSQCECV